MRAADIYFRDRLAGELHEVEEGYRFVYDEKYRTSSDARAISQTLPVQETAYTSPTLFPFFDGLIPEGWLLEIAQENWKLNPRDRMGLLLTCCRDCIGAVSVVPRSEHDEPSEGGLDG